MMSNKNKHVATVDLPYQVGDHVYYLASGKRIECTVDSYELDKYGHRIHLTPIEDSYISNVSILVDSAEKCILPIMDSKQISASTVNCDIHLYQAVAKYKFDEAFDFVIRDLPIHHIEDDCTIVTTNFYAVGPTTISDKFSGVRTLHTGKEIRLCDNMYVLYSTDRQKCLRFIQDHLDMAESKICAFHNIIDKFREQFKEA